MPRGRPRTLPPAEPAARIREFREARGWTIEALSNRTMPRISGKTIQRHETGGNVSTSQLANYARAFGVAPEELLPEGTGLDDQERALIAMFKKLDARGRADFMRLGRALAEQAEPYEPAAADGNGQG